MVILYSTFNRVLDECAGCGEFVCMGAVDGWHRKKRVIRCCCGKTITGCDAVAVLVKWNRLQRKLKAKKTGNKNKWLKTQKLSGVITRLIRGGAVKR